MKTLDFIKVNPAGNTTILIENFDGNSQDLVNISREIMKDTNLYAEQVGFIKGNHLQMMGGEFCGNASRAFASFLAYKDKSFLKENTYSITCSGEKEILKINIRRDEQENKFLAKVKMPKFLSIQEVKINNFHLGLVKFLGIFHFILNINSYSDINHSEVIASIKSYLSTKDYSAFGVMFFDEANSFMKPYVYVKTTDSGVFENSCASGTTALGYYLKTFKNIEHLKIIQPNGWLEFSFENGAIYIDGPVEIIALGHVFI